MYENGLAISGKNKWEDWVKIDSEIGFLYMTYFAKTISKNRTLPMVTDVEQSFSAAIHFEAKINSDYQSQFEYRLGNLLIETIVPKNINDIPLDKLFDIRNKYDGERTAFFDEISDLSISITGIDNGNALEDALAHHSKLILKKTRDLAQLYNSHAIDTIKMFLSISLPTTITSLAEYVSDRYRPFLAVGGVLFGLISAANIVKKKRLELNQNPKSYLLNLKSELSGEDIFTRGNDSIKGIRKW